MTSATERTEQAERLKKARTLAGYHSANAAADAMGVPWPTYYNHENGSNGLSRAGARYAKFFRIRLDWLLTGRGLMRETKSSIRLLGYVGAGAAIYPIHEDAAFGAMDYLDPPDPAELEALLVKGDSQYPRYLDGEIILFNREPSPPERCINSYCVIDVADGRRLVKMLRAGRSKGLFRLESHNTPPEDDIDVVATYRIRGTMER